MTENDKPCILVVDDTPANLDVLKDLLKEDYRVKVAISGLKCLKIAASEPKPDLILLDIMMPDMNGYEVCEHLKNNTETKSIPVIFVTAKSSIEDEINGLNIGAVDYITKPISPPILKARVKTHLQLHNNAILLEHLVDKQTEVLNSKINELEILSKMQQCELDSLSIEEANDHLLSFFSELFDIDKCAFIFPSSVQKVLHFESNAPEHSESEIERLSEYPGDKKRENCAELEYVISIYSEGEILAYLWYMPIEGTLFDKEKIDRYRHLCSKILKSAFIRREIEEGVDLDSSLKLDL